MQPEEREMSTRIWLSCPCSMLVLLGVRHLSCCSSGFCPKMSSRSWICILHLPCAGPIAPILHVFEGGWNAVQMLAGLGEGMCGTGVIFWHKNQWTRYAMRSNVPPTQKLVGPILLPTGPGGGMVSPWMTSQAATALDFDFNYTNLCSSLGQTSHLCVLLSLAFPPQQLVLSPGPAAAATFMHSLTPSATSAGQGPKGRKHIISLQGSTCLSVRQRQGLQGFRRKCNVVMGEGKPFVGFFTTGHSFNWSIRKYFLYLACP